MSFPGAWRNDLIPLRDENPSGTMPVVTLALIITNVLVFMYEVAHGLEPVILEYGLMPASVWSLGGAEVSLGDLPPVTAEIAAQLSARATDAVARASLSPLYFVTAMFLHGGIMHIVGNMWFLWLFGDNIEDRLGHKAFVVFYLVCGIAASVAHVLYVGVDSTTPMVGASGAIAGVLGAYLICYPRARVLTLVPIFIFIQFIRLPAFVFLFLWFGLQIYGAVAASATPDAPGVAWLAHVGGFAVGSVFVIFWPKSKRSQQAKYQATPDLIRAKRS